MVVTHAQGLGWTEIHLTFVGDDQVELGRWPSGRGARAGGADGEKGEGRTLNRMHRLARRNLNPAAEWNVSRDSLHGVEWLPT